jgi:hypothetical protein
MRPKLSFLRTLPLNFLWSPFFVGTLCILLLGIDIVPGKVVSLLVDSPGWVMGTIAIVTVLITLLTIAWFFWSLIQLIRRKVKLSTKRIYQPLISISLVMMTCLFLKLHVPTKLGFLVSYPQFQRAIVPDAVDTGSRVGLFRIESVQYPSKKWKEGVHFQLLSTWDGATSHYGISYRPNLKAGEMPYGYISEQGYDRIWGNWYIFQAGTC